MESHDPAGLMPSVLAFLGAEAVFVACFATVIVNTAARAVPTRVIGLAILGAVTYCAQQLLVPVCLASGRPFWAETVAALLWVQFLGASDLVVVIRVDASQLPQPRCKAATSAIGLLWNLRRVGTPWAVKNIPSTIGLEAQSRTAFIVKRMAVTLLAYCFVDIMVSMPPADPALIQSGQAALFSTSALSGGDVIFRTAMAISYFVTTGVLNLFMNNLGAMAAVFSGLSKPSDCPPLYGSFLDAYTVRRFWSITWHQMFRSFLTGHADLIVDTVLPFVPRRSAISRYTRLAIAFLTSGLIHYHADRLIGVPDNESGVLIFFLLHAVAIMVEDMIGPLFLVLVPARLRRVLGWLWVLAFFAWTTPTWMYPGARLGLDPASLLPVRIVGPYVQQYLNKLQ